MKNIKKIILLSIIFLILTTLYAVYYYHYSPRFELAYSNVKISKNTWDSARFGFPDFVSHLYYKRFDNDYNYKAYLIYFYSSLIGLIQESKDNSSIIHHEIINRISYANITESDKPVIDILYHQYRELFLNELENYHPTSHECDYLSRFLISSYFIYYYNYKSHCLPMDKREFTIIFKWIKENNKNIEIYLSDPFNWKNCDFSTLSDPQKLRNWVALHISSDFIIDKKNYDAWIKNFYFFYKSNLSSYY